jgi:gamma-glutamylcyclotransferase (GGCT)/AIG2-like uncharacterized protein YtfP
MSQELLFSYGTMKTGHINHVRILAGGGKLLGSIRTVAKCFAMKTRMTQNGHLAPAVMIKEIKGHAVSGELYEVSDKLLRTIDAAEGHPVVYKRVQTKLAGLMKPAWMYMFVMEENEGDSTMLLDDRVLLVDDALVFVP